MRLQIDELVTANARGNQYLWRERTILSINIVALMVRTSTAGKMEPGGTAKKLLTAWARGGCDGGQQSKTASRPSVAAAIPQYITYQVHSSKSKLEIKTPDLIALFPT